MRKRVEQRFADDARDVDRRRAQEEAAAARLDEVDEVRIVGAQQEAQVVAQLAGAPLDGGGRLARTPAAASASASSSPAVRRSASVASRPSSAPASIMPVFEVLRHRLGGVAARATPCAVQLTRAIARPAKNIARSLGHPPERAARALRCWRGVMPRRCVRRSGCHGAEQPLAVAHQVVDAVVAERDAEVLRGHVLELVRFVDDQRRAAGSPRRSRSAARRRRRTAGGD